MNIHVVTEGNVGEKKVYRHWIPLANPDLIYVDHISEIKNNNFSIISGGGYPNYFDIIGSAIEDVNVGGNIDRLVVAVDSEEMSYEEKKVEIQEFISKSTCHADVRIVIQHFCLETWALGNQIIISTKPKSEKLRSYMRLYNVRINDPELLPPHDQESLNRAQFAEKYLKTALLEKYKQLTYSKSNPRALLHDKYFERVKQRTIRTGHIQSFCDFLNAFN